MLRREFQCRGQKITVEIVANINDGESPVVGILKSFFSRKSPAETAEELVNAEEGKFCHCIRMFTEREGELVHEHCETEDLDKTMSVMYEKLYRMMAETDAKLARRETKERELSTNYPEFELIVDRLAKDGTTTHDSAKA